MQNHGIHVAANYIFGFPEDTYETMQQTLDLALELNTEMANMYPCQALPGSPLHVRAQQEGWALPDTYQGYGFLSYETVPLTPKNLTGSEVVRFRDSAWIKYHSNPKFLSLISKTFGESAMNGIKDLSAIKLKRKILGE
jgi:radical SAM superfamily enzyme YgiQ (UPF0313 family)